MLKDDTFIVACRDENDDTYWLVSDYQCERGAYPLVWARCSKPLEPGRRYQGRLRQAGGYPTFVRYREQPKAQGAASLVAGRIAWLGNLGLNPADIQREIMEAFGHGVAA